MFVIDIDAQLEKRKVWLDHAVAEYEKSNKRLSETLDRLKRENMMVSFPSTASRFVLPFCHLSSGELFLQTGRLQCSGFGLEVEHGSDDRHGVLLAFG